MGDLDRARQILLRALGGEEQRIAAPAPASSETVRYLLLGDTHSPWTRFDVLARACKEPADRVILTGDLDDGYSVSRYVKYEDVPLIKSLAYTRAIIERIAGAFSRVDILEGNHDTRFEKLLRSSLEPGVVDVIKMLSGGNLSPLRAITQDMPNVTVVETKVKPRFTASWFHQVGDLLVCHADKYSRVPGRTVGDLYSYFQSMSKQFNLAPFRVLAQAHTHQLSWFPVGADGLAVETGCLSQMQGYMLDPSAKGLPQRNGYVTLTQVNGKTDLNSVRCHWFD